MDAIKELKDLKNISKEDILGALGLQSKASAADYFLPVLGLFGAGLLVGVGMGMLLAPKSGREIRDDISREAGKVRDRAVNATADAVDRQSSH